MLLSVLLFWASALAAQQRADFGYGAPIALEQADSAYQASLTVDVYRHAAYADLRDIRVFNASGEVVPYSLHRAVPAEAQRRLSITVPIFPLRGDATKALDALRVTITRDGGTVNVLSAPVSATATQPAPVVGYFIDLREFKESVVALEVAWPDSAPEFAGAVTIAESDDLAQWHTLVQNAPIVNLQFSGLRLQQKRIEFLASHPKFLRLDWVTSAQSVPLLGASVEPVAARSEVHRLTAEAVGVAVEHDGYEFDLRVQAPIDRLSIHLPEMNSLVQAKLWSRPTEEAQWQYAGQATLYRLKRNDREIESPEISISPTADRFWRVTVENKGGMGAGSPRLRGAWIPAELIFVARGAAPFNFVVGNNLAERAEVPLDQIIGRTDVESKLIKPSLAHIGEVISIGGAAKLTQTQPRNWKNWTLWLVLVAGVAILGFMARRLLNEFGKSDSSS